MIKKRVLIIDDDVTILTSMQYRLKDDYTVTTTSGGETALDILAKNNDDFDLNISDLSMPDVNGAKLYLLIQDQYPQLQNKCQFMTACQYGILIDQMNLSQDNPFLQKPFDAAILKTTLEHFFTKNGTNS